MNPTMQRQIDSSQGQTTGSSWLLAFAMPFLVLIAFFLARSTQPASRPTVNSRQLVTNTTEASSLPVGKHTFVAAVSQGADDAEEYGAGEMYLDSSDLEMVWDQGNQLIGIRFTQLPIPAGSKVTSAVIQFTSDETDIGETSLNIQGELHANAPAFRDENFNLSQRRRTHSSIAWSPPLWEADDRGVDQRTPDCNQIVQEVIDCKGWRSGNSMVFLIDGTGRRSAVSMEGGAPPILHVRYTHSNNNVRDVHSRD